MPRADAFIMKSSTHFIKREQKKSFYLHKLTELVHQLSEEEAALREVYISRIDLSADTGICYVYFATCSHQSDDALTLFKNALEVIEKVKPNLMYYLVGWHITDYALMLAGNFIL